MQFSTRLLCGMVLSSALLSAAMAGEGKVISSVTTAGYTYVEFNQNGKARWLAATQLKVKPGNRIRFDDGAPMRDFYSSSLKRTFPEVLFVQRLAVVAEK